MRSYQLLALLVIGLYFSGFFAHATNPEAKKLTPPKQTETIILAAGCFWGVEEFFRKMDGVISTEVGYAGGKTKKPTYEQVSSGNTGHAESVRIVFDPKKLSYEHLLTQFFKMHDPTTLNRQGNDEGSQYRSAIFTNSKEQKEAAQKLMAKIEKSKAWGHPLTTTVVESTEFYPAEEHHQKYLVKHPGGYDNHYLRSLNF